MKTDHMAIYIAARVANPGAVVLIRMGDFWEAFGPMAETVAKVCDIALTFRDVEGQRIRMSGFPVHGRDRYEAALVAAGHAVHFIDV